MVPGWVLRTAGVVCLLTVFYIFITIGQYQKLGDVLYVLIAVGIISVVGIFLYLQRFFSNWRKSLLITLGWVLVSTLVWLLIKE
jgi:hypothetical protein